MVRVSSVADNKSANNDRSKRFDGFRSELVKSLLVQSPASLSSAIITAKVRCRLAEPRMNGFIYILTLSKFNLDPSKIDRLVLQYRNNSICC